jgi:hypothetical protein
MKPRPTSGDSLAAGDGACITVAVNPLELSPYVFGTAGSLGKALYSASPPFIGEVKCAQLTG